MTGLEAQFEDLYGPMPQFSDYKRGETITYRVGSETHTGVIVWVAAAGQIVIEGHRPLPTRYIVERDGAGNSFPDSVWQSDIIVDPQAYQE